VSLLVFAGVVLAAPAGALVRRRLRAPAAKPQAQVPWLARALVWTASLLLLVFYLGLVWFLRDPNEIVFGLAPGLRYLLLLPFLAAVLAVAALLCVLWIWRKKRGALASRLGYTLIVITLFFSLWQLVVWRLFGYPG
jgi:hypothetical protein